MSRILCCSVIALAGASLAAQASETQQPAAVDSPSGLLPHEHLQFSGDARYRYESIDAVGPAWDRQRVRVRFGVDAKVTQTTHAVFKLSTGEGDPRSAHITFSGGYSRKEVGVDLAYLEWTPAASLSFAGGKIPYPTWRPPQSLFTGGDFNPEGFATRYSGESGLFMSGYTFWLEDRSSPEDSRQNGAQVGFGGAGESSEWKLAVSYNDFVRVQGFKPFLDGVNAYGNSLNPDGTLASDFEIVDASTQWSQESYPGTFTLFAHVSHNSQALHDGDAYAAGVEFAPAQVISDWRASYQYARIGQDSLFGQLMDGDFGGGVTDSRGHVLRIAYRPASRASATLSYFDNELGEGADRHDFRLLQLDIDFSF